VRQKLQKLVKLCLKRNIPFVAYRLPLSDQIMIWVQRSGKMLFVEDFSEVAGFRGFVYAPFHRSTNFPVIFFEPEYVSEISRVEDDTIREIEISKPLYPSYTYDLPVEVSRAEYLRQAENMVHAFGPELSKVVLSRVRLVEKPDAFDAGAFFLKLSDAYPDAFVHLINIPGAGCWTGATPEVLLRVADGDAFTVALAGTRKNSGIGDDTWGDKEIEEQEMVALHVENVLLRCGVKNYIKQDPRTVKAGKVEHISTRFDFRPDPSVFDPTSFINRLHPTPAISGLPVGKALELIRETEKHNREYYAGFCGPQNFRGHSDFFVNLRCMKVLSNDLAVYVGGGLTARSVLADEWEETEWKAKTLLNLI